MKKDPYNCIRCGYNAQQKIHMKNHLYNLKKICPCLLNDIELTDEIKEFILLNRIYHIPLPAPVTPITQIINNNNTINNLIANMDSVDKLTKYITFQDTSLIEYPQTISDKFAKRIKKLENGTSNFLVLDKHNLLEVVNQVSSLSTETFENLNIIYDEKFNKLKLYESGGWTESLLINGIRTLLMQIQDIYFNIYECYLIRKIEYSQLVPQHKAKIREQLSEYYKFLGCFEIDPYVMGKNDTEIKYNIDDERFDPCLEFTDRNREIPILYTKMYTEIRDKTLVSQLNKIKKEIIDIIKKNSKKNLDELNKKVFALFNMDEEFKQTILPK
jgi:predicted transcriptional regulator